MSDTTQKNKKPEKGQEVVTDEAKNVVVMGDPIFNGKPKPVILPGKVSDDF